MKGTLTKVERMRAGPASTGNRDSARNQLRDDHVQLTKGEVADLPVATIGRMSDCQLIAVIRAADVPLLRGRTDCHLAYYDRAMLEQLAFLAQRTVRNQGY